MRLDLTVEADDEENLGSDEAELKNAGQVASSRRWIAYARTLRVTTRPRPPRNLDSTRPRVLNRVSKSGEMPSFVFSLQANIDTLVDKLVNEALIPLFHQLHPEKDGWNLSLVNLCATNMVPTAADSKDGGGRDIARMFRNQHIVLKEWRVEDIDVPPSRSSTESRRHEFDTIPRSKEAVDAPGGSEDAHVATQESLTAETEWDDETGYAGSYYSCRVCGAMMPPFAIVAHHRFVSYLFHPSYISFAKLFHPICRHPWFCVPLSTANLHISQHQLPD